MTDSTVRIEDASKQLKHMLEGMGIRGAIGYRVDEGRMPTGLIAHLRIRDLLRIKTFPKEVAGYSVLAKIEDYVDFGDAEQVALLCLLLNRPVT